MFIQIIISLLTTGVYFWLWTGTSGGTVANYSYLLYLFMLACQVPFFFMNKNLSSFKLIFSSKKKFQDCSLHELKKFDSFINFVIKMQFLFAIVFTLIASANLFSNWENRMFIGPNLATTIEAPLFAFVFAIILIPLKNRAKLLAISNMQEDSTPSTKTPAKTIILALAKILFIIIWAVLCFIFLYYFFTKNQIESLFIFDLPAFLLVFLFFSSFLFISNCTKEFVKAVGAVYTGIKISVSEKAKYSQIFQSLTNMLLCVGVASFLIACMGMLCNLEDFSSFGPCYSVAILGFLYSVFVSIILSVMNSVICNRD